MKSFREKFLEEMLLIIKNNPGIRPSELNRVLGKPHTASFRDTLIKRGLVRKERKGTAVYYYPN
ncbi:MAG: helix-turn-helix domain-containing protein [Candidatus Woykebacteria bacterium]